MQVLKILLALAVAVYLMRQVRKPARWIGRPFARLMNRTHSDLTNWGLSHAAIGNNCTILDVGCGGGRTLRKMAALAPAGRLHGVDYAAGSVAVAQRENADLIASGRMQIQQASVSRLPFPDHTFDLVTAIETQYYWPDMPSDMREVWRVLKPGGSLVVIAECYSRGRFGAERLSMKLLGGTVLTVEAQRDLFAGAGFVDVAIHVDEASGWLCAVGGKP